MKRKTYIGIMMMLLLAVTACAKHSDEPEDGNKNRMIAYYREKNTTVSLQGGLNVVDYKIRYQDFATNTTIYLCNKEGCAHKDKNCDANVFDIQGSAAFFYNDQVYVIGLAQLEGFQLWKMNMDGTSRKKLIDVMDGQFLGDMFLRGNKLYYSATKLILDEEQTEQIGADEGYGVVAVIDLDTNEATTLWDGKEGKYEIEKMIVRDDGVYYLANHRAEDYKEITQRIWSDPTITEEEKELRIIEELGKCELKQKVYFVADGSLEVVEKYAHTTMLRNPISLCGVDTKGILMLGSDGYFYLDDRETPVYQALGNVTVTDHYVLSFDGPNTEIIIYDKDGEKRMTSVLIEAPADYYDTATEIETELDETIPDYIPMEPEERIWFLQSPFYSDGENLFFDFVDHSEASVWVLKVSELAEGKCIWHRGV